MTKKAYMKPAIIKVVELKHKYQIMAGSPGPYGVNKRLIEEEEVEKGW